MNSKGTTERIDAPGFRELQAFVVERTGLAYYVREAGAMVPHLDERMAAMSIAGYGDYLNLLRASEAEFDALVARLVVGETYFFRHTEAFAALQHTVLPELLQHNRDRRSLRIWSAGCATGAEPYSLAMLLCQSFGTALHGWDVSIVATDINRQALARAREGRFASWALRGLSEDTVRANFVRDGQTWEVRPEYRKWITFRYGNLASTPAAGEPDDPTAQDLVVCRNVMIYFDRPTICRTLQRLQRAMADGGWLLIGPSEHNNEDFAGFRTVQCPGVTLYRREARTTALPEVADTAARPLVPPPIPPVVRASSTSIPAPKPAKAASSQTDQLRTLANRGDYAVALHEADRLLRQGQNDAQVHYYRALVLGHLGQQQECEQALRSAIYLDRNHALAHYELGLALRARGDSAAARRALRNALRALDGRDAGEQLCGEEVTVRELAGLVSAQLQTMQEQAR